MDDAPPDTNKRNESGEYCRRVTPTGAIRWETDGQDGNVQLAC